MPRRMRVKYLSCREFLLPTASLAACGRCHRVQPGFFRPDIREPAGSGQPGKYEGKRSERIVWNPGDAARTAGIELTVIDAVAMSPCTPPSIFEASRGTP